MKATLLIALTTLLTVSNAKAQLESHYEENPIEIHERDGLDKDKMLQINVGEKVTFAIVVYETEFFGDSTICANAVMKNTTDEEVKAVYSISFHNADGELVGCYQCKWDIESQDEINFGSAFVYATPEEIATVTSYKLRTQVLEAKE